MKTRVSLTIPPPHHASGSTTHEPGASPASLFVYPVLPVGEGCTLQALRGALGPPDPELTPILLRAWDDAYFLAQGNQMAPERIVKAVPKIIITAAASLGSLDADAASLVMIDPGILAAIVDEALAIPPLSLRRDRGAHLHVATLAGWNAHRARVRRDAITWRDVLSEALRRALADRDDLIGVVRGDAEDDDALARGLAALADLAETKLSTGTVIERAALERFQVTAAKVAKLRAKAARVRALGPTPVPPPRAVAQHALDVQEGRVLMLIDILLKAMRAARRGYRAMVMPDLGALKSWYAPPQKRPKP